MSAESFAPLMFAGLVLVMLIGFPVAFSLSALGLPEPAQATTNEEALAIIAAEACHQRLKAAIAQAARAAQGGRAADDRGAPWTTPETRHRGRRMRAQHRRPTIRAPAWTGQNMRRRAPPHAAVSAA